jgi:hypothetical protein
VVFDEEGEWDFEIHKKEYSFFPEFEEETPREVQQAPNSPTSPASEGTRSERIVRRTRSLQDLYDNTEALSPRRLKDFYEEIRGMDNITLFCLFADCEPMNFEEVGEDNRWIHAMDEDIRAIEKNNTWELVSLPKGHKAISVKWVYKAKRISKEKLKDTKQY